ncbi:MAG: outer membrane lipoprotein carrier protein LolA [bacterium]
MIRRPGLLFCALVLQVPLFLAVPAAKLAAAPTNDVQLADIARVMSSASTVFARFEEERYVSLFDEPLKSDGYLCFVAPNLIRWEMSGPYRSILISNGRNVGQFEWMNGKREKLNTGLEGVVRQVTGQMAMILRGQFKGDRKDSYQASVAVTNGVTVNLVPRGAGKAEFIASMSVQFSPDLTELRSVTLVEPDGDKTVIRFSGMRTNVTFAAGTFDTSAPSDIAEILKALPQ